MAMHKKLELGTALFKYHTVSKRSTYNSYHRFGNYDNDSYFLTFSVIYVANRRERSSGASVPREAIPTLEKWGIRIQDYNKSSDTVYAVGCRSHSFYVNQLKTPFPT